MNRGIASLARFLPLRIASAVNSLPQNTALSADEIRLRRESAVSLTCGGKNLFFDQNGAICSVEKAIKATDGEMAECLSRLSGGSLYTCDGMLAQGFIPIPGGGRAGVCGRAEVRNGRIIGFSEVYSINLRLHRFVRDFAIPLMREFTRAGIKGTLVISPPAEGKTTFLRSAAYLLANGRGIAPTRVGIADEREEISAGLPKSGLLDILSGAPKADSISILTRTLAPQVVICDEISGSEWESVLETQNCGVALIASAHGSDIGSVARRPGMKRLIDSGAFGLCVCLHRGETPIPTAVEAVLC